MKLYQKPGNSGSVTSGAAGIPRSVPRAAFGFGSMIKKKKTADTPVSTPTPKKPTTPTSPADDTLRLELDDANRRISVTKVALSHVTASINLLQQFANAVPTNMRSDFQTSINRAIQATDEARTGLELSRRMIITPGFGDLVPGDGDVSILPIGPAIPIRTEPGWASIPENWGKM